MKRIKYNGIVLAIVLTPVSIFGLPTGQDVVSGSVSFQTDKTQMNITASDKSIINYDSFSIDKDELVKFIQPSVNSVVLNRVIKENPSEILGLLEANGNIFLINPSGILFGKDSIVNTHGLLATTLDISDKDFLNENFVFKQNSLFQSSYLISKGTINVSPEGFVVLASPFVSSEGTIIAKSGTIHIGAVDNFYINFDSNGLINFDYKPSSKTNKDILLSKSAADAIMKSVVNYKKTNKAVRLVKQGGKIKLVGGRGLAFVNGKLSTKGRRGGRIHIIAQNRAVIANKANIIVDSDKSGGSIFVYSYKDLIADKYAKFSARGIEGDGGFIELSALESVMYYGSYVDTTSVYGYSGLFYIDPKDLVINSNQTDINSNYVVEADNKITIKDNLSLSTTSGNNIAMYAPNIAIGDSSEISSGGDLTIQATHRPDKKGNYKVSSSSSIEIGKSVKLSGKDIKISAEAYDNSMFETNDPSFSKESLSKVGDFIIDIPITPIAYKSTSASSSINIKKGVSINGDSVSIESKSTADTNIKSLFSIIALSYGKAKSVSNVNIGKEVIINAADGVTISSEANLANEVLSEATNKPASESKILKQNIAVAYTKSETNSIVNIDSGAVIKANSFVLNSTSNVGIATGANGLSNDKGNIAAAVAVSESTSDASTVISGTVDAKSVKIESTLNIDQINTTASSATAAGDAITDYIADPETKGTEAIVSQLMSLDGKLKKSSGANKVGLSASLAYAKHTNSANVKVDKGIIKTDGDIDIGSNVEYAQNSDFDDGGDTTIFSDSGLKTIAISTADSEEPSSSSSSSSQGNENGFGGAIVITDVSNKAVTEIGSDSTLDAKSGNIKISSNISMGYNIAWDNFSKFNSFTDFADKTDDIDLQGRIFTTYAVGSSQGTKNSIAGSYNYFTLNNDSEAKIDNNVKINQNIKPEDVGTVDILANSDIETINFSGTVKWLDFSGLMYGIKFGSGGVKGANNNLGVGGSYLSMDYTNNTIASIGQNTEIDTYKLYLNAVENLNNIAVSSAGSSGNNALSGALVLFNLNDTTDSTLKSSTIDIFSNGNAEINAKDSLENISIAGGITKGKNVGVGASGVYNDISRDTTADISSSTIKSENGSDSTSKFTAENDGYIKAFSLAGTVKGSTKNRAVNQTAGTSTDLSSNTQNTQSVSQNGISSSSGSGKYGFAVSGDSSKNKVKDNAKVNISDTQLYLSNQNIKIDVKNSSDIYAYSGSAALSFGADKSMGLAGSYAQNSITNSADISIKHNKIDKAKSLEIYSHTTGEYIVASGSGSISTNGASLAGSVAINDIQNSSVNYLFDNYINIFADISLSALDDTTYKYYAGAFSLGTNLGVGLSYGQNSIENTIASKIAKDSKSDKEYGSISAKSLKLSSIQNNNTEGYSATASIALSGMAAAGSVAINHTNSDISSYIYNVSVDTPDSTVSLTSRDSSDITLNTGILSASVSGSLGVSLTDNQISNNIKSNISTTNLKSGSVVLTADSNRDINLHYLGGSVSAGLVIDGKGLNNQIHDNTKAYITNSTLTDIKDGVSVYAVENNNINTDIGSIEASGKIAIGVSVANSEIGNKISASISDSTIDTLGHQKITLKKSYADGDEGIHVEALSNEKLESHVANMGASLALSAIGGMNLSNYKDELNSYIKESNIDAKSSDKEQGVVVRSKAANEQIFKSGVVSAGLTGGLGATVTKSNNQIQTEANIASSKVNTNSMLRVASESKDTIESDTVSGSGAGVASIAGGINIFDFQNTNSAYVSDNSNLKSDNTIHIVAGDKTYLGGEKNNPSNKGILTTVASVSTGGSIPGAVAVNSIKNRSYAYIKDSTTNSKQSTYIHSYNLSQIINTALAGSYGALALNGSTVVNTIETTTKAYTDKGVVSNKDEEYSNDQQEFKIKADDTVNVSDNIGGLGASLGATVGASIEVTTVKTDTLAYIGKDNEIYAKKGVSVESVNNKDLSYKNIAGGVSEGASLSGAITVVNAGDSITKDIKNVEDNINDIFSKISESLTGVNISDDKIPDKLTKSTENRSRAYIDDGSKIYGGDVTIDAKNYFNNIDIYTGGGSGATLSIGGSANFVYLGASTKAFVGDNANIYFDNLNISSYYEVSKIDASAYASKNGAITFGADYMKISNEYDTVSATEKGVVLSGLGDAKIESKTAEYNIKPRAYGDSIAAVAVAGISYTDYQSNGNTKTVIDESNKLYTLGNMDLSSVYTTYIDSFSKASSGGVLNGSGSVSNIKTTPTISTEVYSNTKIGSDKDIRVSTASYEKEKSNASGTGNISGAKVGVSKSEVVNNPVIHTIFAHDVILGADNVYINTLHNYKLTKDYDPKSLDDKTVSSEAYSSAGANLVNADSVLVSLKSKPDIKTYIGKDTHIASNNNININTVSNTNTNTKARSNTGTSIVGIGNVKSNLTNEVKVYFVTDRSSSIFAKGNINIYNKEKKGVNADVIGSGKVDKDIASNSETTAVNNIKSDTSMEFRTNSAVRAQKDLYIEAHNDDINVYSDVKSYGNSGIKVSKVSSVVNYPLNSAAIVFDGKNVLMGDRITLLSNTADRRFITSSAVNAIGDSGASAATADAKVDLKELAAIKFLTSDNGGIDILLGSGKLNISISTLGGYTQTIAYATHKSGLALDMKATADNSVHYETEIDINGINSIFYIPNNKYKPVDGNIYKQIEYEANKEGEPATYIRITKADESVTSVAKDVINWIFEKIAGKPVFEDNDIKKGNWFSTYVSDSSLADSFWNILDKRDKYDLNTIFRNNNKLAEINSKKFANYKNMVGNGIDVYINSTKVEYQSGFNTEPDIETPNLNNSGVNYDFEITIGTIQKTIPLTWSLLSDLYISNSLNLDLEPYETILRDSMK